MCPMWGMFTRRADIISQLSVGGGGHDPKNEAEPACSEHANIYYKLTVNLSRHQQRRPEYT